MVYATRSRKFSQAALLGPITDDPVLGVLESVVCESLDRQITNKRTEEQRLRKLAAGYQAEVLAGHGSVHGPGAQAVLSDVASPIRTSWSASLTRCISIRPTPWPASGFHRASCVKASTSTSPPSSRAMSWAHSRRVAWPGFPAVPRSVRRKTQSPSACAISSRTAWTISALSVRERPTVSPRDDSSRTRCSTWGQAEP